VVTRALGALVASLCLSLAALATSDTTTVASELPDMGSPENAVLSKTDELQIGMMVMRQLRGQGLILEDPELTDYIQQLGSRLASQARDDDQNFQYFIFRSSEINAFATFGGFICVNSGLILLSATESDLAGVLAHETAHVRQRHIARSVVAQNRMSLGSAAAMVAAVLIGAAAGAGGQAMQGAIAMSQGVALQQSMNFTATRRPRPIASASACWVAPASMPPPWPTFSSRWDAAMASTRNPGPSTCCATTR